MHEPYEDMVLCYSAGLLSQSDRKRLEQHLTECQICRDALEEWQLIGAAARVVAQDRAVTLPPLNLEINKEQAKMNSASIKVVPQRSLAVVFSVAALLALMFGVLIARSPDFNVSMIQPAQTTPAGFVEVVLAAQPIERGSVITAEDVVLYALPEDVTPFNAVVNLDDVIGKNARTSIPCGQPVLTNMLVDDVRDVFDGSDFTYGCETIDLSPLQEPVLTELIVMAAQELPGGIVIPDDGVMLRPYPAQLVPDGAINNLTDVIGRIMRDHVVREQVILRPMLRQIEPGETAWGTHAQTILPAGMYAVMFPVENIQTDLQALQPGMYVDIIVAMQFVPVDDIFQTPFVTDSNQESKRIMQRIASNSQILTKEGSFITIVVTPEESRVLTWVVEAGFPLLLAQVD